MKVGKSPTKVSNVIIPTRLSRSTSHNSSNGHEDHEDDLQVQHEVALASEEVNPFDPPFYLYSNQL